MLLDLFNALLINVFHFHSSSSCSIWLSTVLCSEVVCASINSLCVLFSRLLICLAFSSAGTEIEFIVRARRDAKGLSAAYEEGYRDAYFHEVSERASSSRLLAVVNVRSVKGTRRCLGVWQKDWHPPVLWWIGEVTGFPGSTSSHTGRR